jgi:hypothetical protein
MAKRKRTHPLYVLPGNEQPSRYTSIASVDREAAAIERTKAIARQDAQRAELIAANDTRVREHYLQDGETLMSYPVTMEDRYSGLLPGEHEPDAGARFMAENPNLDTEALRTIGKHAESCAKHHGAGLTLENLYRSMERLQDLGVFQKPAEPEPAPAAKQTFEDLLNERGTDDKEVRAKLHESIIGGDGVFSKQFNEHQQWMIDTFQYVCPEHVLAAFWREFQNNSLSPMQGKNWASIRLKLRADGTIPPHCWLLSEKLASDYRKGILSDYDYKRAVRVAGENGTLDAPVSRAEV